MITRLPAERVNFWTHAAGFLAWIPFTAALVILAWPRPDLATVAAVYGLGVLFLFFCSSWYHRNKRQENEMSVWRTLDHVAIFVMIAATYTPVVWIWFDEPWRTATLILQWSLTAAGLAFKLFVPRAPRWIGPVLYLLMGWVAVLAIVPLYQKMPWGTFVSLWGGGVWYTVGAVVYATKWPRLWPGTFGFHEFFHVFILGGAATHGVLVARSIAAALARG
jgi:hemolysin III